MAEDPQEGKFYATFERLNDLKKYQDDILGVDLFDTNEFVDGRHLKEKLDLQKFTAVVRRHFFSNFSIMLN